MTAPADDGAGGRWRTIDSAPKDGTQFAAIGHHWDTWQSEELFICWCDTSQFRGAGWVCITDGMLRTAQPRLWHALDPLPPPPKGESPNQDNQP